MDQVKQKLKPAPAETHKNNSNMQREETPTRKLRRTYTFILPNQQSIRNSLQGETQEHSGLLNHYHEEYFMWKYST